jgi:hypothetical protein
MFGIGKKGGGPSFKELSGVILSEHALMGILQPRFDKRIRHITKDAGSFTLNFDDNETVNAYVLGHEDIVRIMQEYYGRTVIEVGMFDEGHEQYHVRFED